MPREGYRLRKGRDGWGVYLLSTGKPVELNGRVQTGLPRETAAELAAALAALHPSESGSRDGIP
ncbi:hypothetical protein [Methylobacterium sp. ID0610]|uniref:hypothetical protein n=1 Tax=Methylobacterium carpenticola TaxID=3344827 RepID=UPI00368CC814